jgi:hypothetical protein
MSRTAHARQRLAATTLGLMTALAAPCAAFDLELDPGLGWSILSGVGQGRSVYFSANETFMIQGAGFSANMIAGDYEVIIYQGDGEQAPAGPVLHSVQVPLGGIGLAWQDAAISFQFIAGQDYILHFRHSVPGTTVASEYQRASVFWGNSPLEFRDLGVVTIRDGREGYTSQNPSNAAFPRMRLLGISTEPLCYANCDGSTVPPILNVEDFSCFINEFAAAQALPPQQQFDHYANCDESTTPPVLNVEDFTCFINRFAQGCR